MAVFSAWLAEHSWWLITVSHVRIEHTNTLQVPNINSQTEKAKRSTGSHLPYRVHMYNDRDNCLENTQTLWQSLATVN